MRQTTASGTHGVLHLDTKPVLRRPDRVRETSEKEERTMTDPAVTIVFFAAVLLAVCAVFAVVEASIERRERWQTRELRRRMRDTA